MQLRLLGAYPFGAVVRAAVTGAFTTVIINCQHRIRATRKVPISNVNTPRASPPRPKTIRISRIPKAISREKLQTWLESLTPSNKLLETKNVIQLSIAPENEEFSQATVTLLSLPPHFQNLGEDTISCEGPDTCEITIDTHFLGMTVLYDPIQVNAGPTMAELVTWIIRLS